jgi:hypothetical protein
MAMFATTNQLHRLALFKVVFALISEAQPLKLNASILQVLAMFKSAHFGFMRVLAKQLT